MTEMIKIRANRNHDTQKENKLQPVQILMSNGIVRIHDIVYMVLQCLNKGFFIADVFLMKSQRK